MKTTDLTPGQTIFHQRFGEMIVKEITSEENQTVMFTVKSTSEEKHLLLRFARLSFTDGNFESKAFVGSFYEIPERPAFIGITRESSFASPAESNQGTFFGDYINQGCSNRHLEARSNISKLTAGEMAKLLTKELGRKVLAADIAEFATEWHHAGVFRKSNGRTGGKKVYWFQTSEKESLIKKLTK